jgi:hypothetical protein
MPFFEEHVPIQVQKKAYENLAYELLDNYLAVAEEDEAEERLMETLKNEIQPHYSKWYAKYTESEEITKCLNCTEKVDKVNEYTKLCPTCQNAYNIGFHEGDN